MKVVAVIPVYNEESTLREVLARVCTRVDLVVCVNDGSTDGSLALLRRFARTHRNTYIVDLPRNRGMAGALEQGFLFVLHLRGRKVLGPDDVVVTIDADGQHKPEYLPEMVRYMYAKKADVVLTRRDFSLYPAYKIAGNHFLTWTNSVLSGMRYHDVESGLRALRVKTLEPILGFYTGVKYSCAQEIALISARSGFKIDNDFKVTIARYRKGTTFWDGFIVLALSLVAFGRWRFNLRSGVTPDSAAMAEAYEGSLKLRGPAGGKRGRV